MGERELKSNNTSSNIKKGIVCFSDILGYLKLLENNDIFKTAEIIENIILSLQKKVEDKLQKRIPNIKKYLEEHIKLLIVSDSIIIFSEDLLSEKDKELYILVTVLYMIAFFEEVFDSGLPMRTCIDYGNYFLHDYTYAGKTIVNTYKKSQELEFSGIALTEEFCEYVEKNKENDIEFSKYMNNMIFKYEVPVKEKGEGERNILNWLNEESIKKIKEQNFDLEQYIFEKFHAHNKGVNESVMKKIKNTERIMRFFITKV